MYYGLWIEYRTVTENGDTTGRKDDNLRKDVFPRHSGLQRFVTGSFTMRDIDWRKEYRWVQVFHSKSYFHRIKCCTSVLMLREGKLHSRARQQSLHEN